MRMAIKVFGIILSVLFFYYGAVFAYMFPFGVRLYGWFDTATLLIALASLVFFGLCWINWICFKTALRRKAVANA